jgi:uncharacterized protein
MMQSLKKILQLQELDMKMLRLMEVKEKRQEELADIRALRKELQEQLFKKQHEVLEFKKSIRLAESDVRDVQEKIKGLEAKQSAVKKVDEFNALSQEITRTDRERVNAESKIGDLIEQLQASEEVLQSLEESLESTTENSKILEEEIQQSIQTINVEGRDLEVSRNELSKDADEELLAIYERLLHNKRDRVVVPIENRTCSGCHIVLTPQHENVVRKGERLVFCEHCSRIHYWQEAQVAEATEEEGTKRRRRRQVTTS